MCLDTACVSKATNWWANPIVSIWRGRGFRPWGPIGAIVGKGADKVYYDILVGRPSTYRGNFEGGHSSARAGGNQCDVRHAGAKAKSNALDDGAWHAGVRSLIFHPTLRPLTPNFHTRLAEYPSLCQNGPPRLPRPNISLCTLFIHGCINVFHVTSTKPAPSATPTPPTT